MATRKAQVIVNVTVRLSRETKDSAAAAITDAIRHLGIAPGEQVSVWFQEYEVEDVFVGETAVGEAG